MNKSVMSCPYKSPTPTTRRDWLSRYQKSINGYGLKNRENRKLGSKKKENMGGGRKDKNIWGKKSVKLSCRKF